MGQATTAADGAYAVGRSAGNGNYYAQVAVMVVPNEAACDDARSPKVTVR